MTKKEDEMERKNRFTPMERRLLDCLQAKAGEVIGHEDLIEAMTGHELYYMANRRQKTFLRQQISRLRQKIEKDPALPDIIITHRGRGYSYEGPRPCKS